MLRCFINFIAIRLLLIGLLLLTTNVSMAKIFPDLDAENRLSGFPFPLRISVEEVVEILRQDLHVRVHFELENIDFERDGLSAYKIIEMYGSVPAESLSKREKRLLSSAREKVSLSKGHVVIDYRKPYLELDLVDFIEIEQLKRKVEESGIYSLKVSNGSVIVYPRGSDYKNVDQFLGTFQSCSGAFKRLSEELGNHDLSLRLSPIVEKELQSEIKLNIQSEDFRVFLSRFAESIGDEVVWSIGGYNQGRHIIFTEL